MKFSGGDLSALRKAMLNKVDEEAEGIRASIITLGAGMALVYPEKRREAESYFASAGTISEFETPHITREATKFGTTRESVAVDIMTSALTWAEISSRIDALRVWHRDLIEKATNAQAIRQAANVDWDIYND